MKEYGPIHTLWSASEEDLVDSLKGVANCIDKCCKATEKRMTGLSENLLPVIHEYVLYSDILMVRPHKTYTFWCMQWPLQRTFAVFIGGFVLIVLFFFLFSSHRTPS